MGPTKKKMGKKEEKFGQILGGALGLRGGGIFRSAVEAIRGAWISRAERRARRSTKIHVQKVLDVLTGGDLSK